MKALQSALRHLSRGQFRALLSGLQRRIPVAVFRHQRACLFELQLDGFVPSSDNDISYAEGYLFCEFSSCDSAVCAAFSQVPEDVILDRFDHGDRCFGMLSSHHRLVHSAWVHFGPCYVRGLGLRLDLDDTECYLYEVTTDPPHRGRKLYHHSLRKITQILQAAGARRILQLIEHGNDVPLKALPRIGYEPLWTIWHVTLFGAKLSIIYDPAGKQIDKQSGVLTPSDVFVI